MGKSIRSKIKRKYRAQRAGTVEALGIVESKEKKKQEALQSSMTPSMPEKEDSMMPPRVNTARSRVKKKVKTRTSKPWSALPRKENVQM